MKVRVDIPELLPQLSEFLEDRGYEVVARGEDEIGVSAPHLPQDFRGAVTLLADLDIWRAKHPWAHTRLDPELTRG